jgi:hypothetical protein
VSAGLIGLALVFAWIAINVAIVAVLGRIEHDSWRDWWEA